MKVIRVSDEAYQYFNELADKERRSVCKQMDLVAEYAKTYLANREKEEYLKNVALDSVMLADEFNKRQKEKKENEKLFKKMRKAEIEKLMTEQSEVIVDNEQVAPMNKYTPDTYEWYLEESYSRELTNDEVLRMNELRLIKEGWDKDAAHKKIYC